MIFVQANLEEVLQVNDITRLSFNIVKTPGEEAISLIEVDAGTGFFDVTSNTDRQGRNYLDFAFDAAGVKAISVRVTTASQVLNFAFSMEAISVEDDRLFSSDSDLVSCEDDILNFVRKGRVSFLDKHREAQKRILEKLDKERIYLRDGSRIQASNISQLEEVSIWSKFKTLEIIYNGLINETGDVFAFKADKYMNMAKSASNKAAIRIKEDLNGDGDSTDPGEERNLELKSTRLLRR